ncbi:hypothetical protein T03_14494 [Trichinella britovi]|uniref:Uncharacterized protein n=2 Tax=Trichinella TaxID=6333 RepID=A0A0V1CAE2_TRIBR|nr:hypothetical protein T05_13801 [Trichinella murrelli]KRY45998.1 hypothetical protein T03_14494 [Trichinella britovi]
MVDNGMEIKRSKGQRPCCLPVATPTISCRQLVKNEMVLTAQLFQSPMPHRLGGYTNNPFN